MSELIANDEPADEVEGAISFNELIKVLWKGRNILLICIVGALIAGFGIVLNAIPQYSAEIKIAPAESNFSPTPNSTAQSLVSIVTGGSQQYDDYAHFLDLLHSMRLATVLDERYHLMKDVFPFDQTTQTFVPESGLIPLLVRSFRRLIGLPDWRPPTTVDLATYLTNQVEINKHADSSASITYRNRDATVARASLQHLYDETDKLIREEKLRTRTAMRDYVSKRLNDAATIDQRAVLIQLWGTEETQMLLLGSGDPVGARIIDDIAVSNLPSTGAARILLIAAVGGTVLGMLIVIVRSAIPRA